MSRRGGRKHKQSRGGGYNFWQSESMNNALVEYYRDILIKMAMTRFKWVNLPPTCDERFLEWTLVTQGVATIAFPRKMPGTFYSTQAVVNGRMNVYDNPTRWRSFGNYGWNFSGTQGKMGPLNRIGKPSECYLVFDSGDPCVMYCSTFR